MKEEVQFLPLELRSLWKEDRIMSMCRGTVRKACGQARPASRDPRKPDLHRERLEMTGHQGSVLTLQTPPGGNSAHSRILTRVGLKG